MPLQVTLWVQSQSQVVFFHDKICLITQAVGWDANIGPDLEVKCSSRLSLKDIRHILWTSILLKTIKLDLTAK